MMWWGQGYVLLCRYCVLCGLLSGLWGFSSGACLSSGQIFLMWHVQAFQSLSLLKDRHPCLVLKSVYLLIRDSSSSQLGAKLFPKDYFQHCCSSALSPPHYICSTESLFHLIMGLIHLHGCCLFCFIPKTKKTLCCDLQKIPACSTNLKHMLICVQSLVTRGLWGHLKQCQLLDLIVSSYLEQEELFWHYFASAVCTGEAAGLSCWF